MIWEGTVVWAEGLGSNPAFLMFKTETPKQTKMSTKSVALNGRVLVDNTMSTKMEIVKDVESLVGDLRRDMAKGVVSFIFRKKDGEERFATGTTSPDYFPQKTSGQFADLMEKVENCIKATEKEVMSKQATAWDELKAAHLAMIQEKLEGPKAAKNLDVVTYYDLTSRAWRAFSKENLVCVFTA